MHINMNSEKVLYALTIGVILSLTINAALIYTLYSTKQDISTGMAHLSQELEDLKDEPISFTYNIDEEKVVPVEFSTAFDETVTVEVPVDTTTEVRIVDEVATTIVLNGKRQRIVVPIDTRVTVPVKDTVEVDVPLHKELTFKKDIIVPLQTTLTINTTLEEMGLGSIIDRLIAFIEQAM